MILKFQKFKSSEFRTFNILKFSKNQHLIILKFQNLEFSKFPFNKKSFVFFLCVLKTSEINNFQIVNFKNKIDFLRIWNKSKIQNLKISKFQHFKNSKFQISKLKQIQTFNISNSLNLPNSKFQNLQIS